MAEISAKKTEIGAVVLNPAEGKGVDQPAVEKARIVDLGGTILVTSKVDEPLVSDGVDVGGVLPHKTADGFTVMVQEVEDVVANVKMAVSDVQVAWEDIRKDVAKVEDDIKKVVQLLVGTVKVDAEKVLEDLVKTSKILSFRFVHPGQAYTADFEDGRVQLFVDKDNKVKDAVVG